MTWLCFWLMVCRTAHGLRFNYFAYGSNVNPKVFTERRGIVPLSSGRGRLVDYRLAFSLRGSGAEPAFAAVEPCLHGGVVHGVLYSLSPADWLRLCASEAAPVVYGIENVEVELYAEADSARLCAAGTPCDETVEAMTLVVNEGPWKIDRFEDEPLPSTRYARLLYDGAVASRLDREWISSLEDIWQKTRTTTAARR